MKTLHSKIALGSLALAFGVLACAGSTNVVLTTSDINGAVTSLNGAGKWNDANPPHAGANYFSTNFFIRTPTDSGGVTYTFGGDSLSLGPVPSGTARNIIVKSGNGDTFVINNLTNLLGGILENGGSGGGVSATFTGNLWTISANSAVVADQGPLVIGYPLAGADGVLFTNAGGNANGITFNGVLTAFTGKFYISTANFGNGGGNTRVILNAANCFPGNPSTPTPDQVRLEGGCTLQDNVGLNMNNANGGIMLFGSATINAGSVTLIGEPITDLTNGFVSSLATLTTAGAGTLVLSNANNNYSGGTVVSAGTLRLGVDNAIPGFSTNGNVSVSSGASLDLNGHIGTINGLNGAGNVDNASTNAATLVFGANGAGGALSGTVQNSGGGALSLTKIGAGTETLSGAFNYSGATTVGAGTLVMTTALGVPTTGGNLVISNGATLTADASSVNPFPISNLLEATNSTLNFTLSAALNGINASGGLTFQDNAINNLSYGTVTANPTALFINAAGGISAPGTNIMINIAATGLQIGTFTLIKYTGTPLSSLANFQLNPPPGVAAVLVNNTGNDSIDIQITAIPHTLSWYGTAGGNWDLTTPNWSNTIAGGTTVFQQYTNGSVIAGDAVTFDDTLTNDLVNPQPTNITLNSTFYAFPVVVNSTLPYSISGTGGITGVTSLLKTNTGTLTLNVSNSYTGGTIIDAGALIITNDSALGTNRGLLTLGGGSLQINSSFTNNLRPISVPAESSIGVSTGNSVRLGGRVTGTTLDNIGNGTLVLGGTNTYSGDLFLHKGTMVIDSGGVVTNSNYDDVGQNTTDNATLTLKGTGSLGTSSDFNVGDLDSSTGTLNIQDTALLRANAIFIGSANATGSTASGTVNQTGGTVTEVSTAVGVFSIGGRTSTSGVGTYNISGGTLTANGGIRVGGTGVGTFNVNGGTVNAMAGVNIARIAGSFGTNNLNGGLLATLNVTSSTQTNAIFNFNGGTLQAQFNPANPWFTSLQQANILAGGAIIDSSTNSAIVTQPLLAGSPNGGLTKLGSGTITLNGVNTFTGPITNNAGTLVLNNASTYPGAVVVNAGILSLTAANNLQGPVSINGGTLQMTPVSQISGATAIKTNATLAIVQSGSSTATVGNLTFNGVTALPGASLTVTLSSANVPTVPFVNAGTLTLNGTNTINLSGAILLGPTAIVKYSGAIAGPGSITNLILPQGASGYVSNNAASSTLYVVVTNAGPGLVWTGTNSAPGHTNLWDITTTTNWLVNGLPTWYQQFAIPGDAVNFNDIGSGVVLLSNNVAPGNLVISNSAKAYTFNGSGLITGPTSLTKLGTGTATINLTNNYSGSTTISNGTLLVGSPSAISQTGNLVLGPSGTLELAGNNQTAGDLIGSGVVNNNSGVRSVLTIGGTSGGTWNGTITNTGGGGGLTFHKLGSGTWVTGGSNYFNDGQPFQTQNSVNAGTLIITNGGLVSIPFLELRIADGSSVNSATSSVVVAGGTLVVTNNPLSVGVNSNNANGTFIVNSGTVITGTGDPAGFFSGSANNLTVGANGATGTMIVNGGVVVDGQNLWLGQNTGASGTLFLNGGVLQVSSIANFGTPTTSIANFNGGTLRAFTNNADFLDPAVTYNILSNGIVLDDNGFTLSTTATIQDGDAFNGSLIKKGSGAVYFDAANNYVGTTLVTNGTFGGSGSLSGAVVVAPAGNIAPGDAGASVSSPLTISSNLTLQGAATFRINITGGSPLNDQILGIATANYGGTLVVSNVTTDATVLTNGQTFPLFSATTGTGNFANIAGSPGAGLSYVFHPDTGVLSVTNVVVKSVPHFTSIHLSGTTLTIAGTNGTSNGQFVLLGSTNVHVPIVQWTPLLTNAFDVNGNFNLTTNIVNPAVPIEFYLLSQ
jgi:autotransporter-associated beta strand protein